MKKFFITVVLSLSCVLSVSAQKQTEASTLNLIGKPFESTPNPYHRVDTLVYKGFNRTENRQLRCSAGMAVLFIRTVKARYAINSRIKITASSLPIVPESSIPSAVKTFCPVNT